MRILSFDPGGTTGWAYHELVRDQLTGGPKIEGGQLGPHRHHKELWDLLYNKNPDRIIFEQFDYRVKDDTVEGKQTPGIVLVSVEYIGILFLWRDLHPNKVVLYQQSSSYGGAGGKSSNAFWSNDKLKAINVYHPGKQHQNDATRHMLVHITEGPLMRKDYLHMFKPKRKIVDVPQI